MAFMEPDAMAGPAVNATQMSRQPRMNVTLQVMTSAVRIWAGEMMPRCMPRLGPTRVSSSRPWARSP